MKHFVALPEKPAVRTVETGGRTSSNPLQMLAKPALVNNEKAPVQGLLLEGALALLGLGGLAYGGYRYFRHRQRENTMQDIHNEQANLTTNVGHGNDGIGNPTSQTQAVNGALAQHLRTYNIHINDDDPVGLGRTDQHLINVAEFHENTHASADMAYSGNANQSSLFLEHGNAANPAVFGPLQIQQWTFRDARVQRLKQIVNADNALTALQQQEILTRLGNAEMSIEYDPTINELLMYTREYGIAANSETVKALVLLARESLARRGPGGGNMAGNWPA